MSDRWDRTAVEGVVGREAERLQRQLDYARAWGNGPGAHELADRFIEEREQDGAKGDAEAMISRALFDDPEKTGDATGPAREEVPGGCGLAHRGQAAILFSARGQGKSTVALVVGLSIAVQGGRVFYFDRENGGALTLARIEAILEHHDWPDVLADGRFVGRHYPHLDKGWDPEAYGEAVASRGFTHVIYDSLREAISQLGGDPNSDADISRFIDLAVTPLVRRGISVVVLDNTGHEAKNRPKGSGSKLDAVPQAYKVSTSEQFTPALLGRVGIECTRSRFGDEGRTWTMRVGAGTFETPEALEEAPDERAAREIADKRERFRVACIECLRTQSPMGRDPLITAARERGIKGRNNKLREWLLELAADPTSGFTSGDEGYVLTPGPDPLGQGGATPLGDPPAPTAPLPTVGARGPGPGPDDPGHPRYEPGCSCVTPADLDDQGRCERCFGYPDKLGSFGVQADD